MLEFYPNLNQLNGGLMPGAIDSQMASVPNNNNNCNNNNRCNINSENITPTPGTIMPQNNVLTQNSATAPTLSNCVGHTGKIIRKFQ